MGRHPNPSPAIPSLKRLGVGFLLQRPLDRIYQVLDQKREEEGFWVFITQRDDPTAIPQWTPRTEVAVVEEEQEVWGLQ